jgi:hypothetical protein
MHFYERADLTTRSHFELVEGARSNLIERNDILINSHG